MPCGFLKLFCTCLPLRFTCSYGRQPGDAPETRGAKRSRLNELYFPEERKKNLRPNIASENQKFLAHGDLQDPNVLRPDNLKPNKFLSPSSLHSVLIYLEDDAAPLDDSIIGELTTDLTLRALSERIPRRVGELITLFINGAKVGHRNVWLRALTLAEVAEQLEIPDREPIRVTVQYDRDLRSTFREVQSELNRVFQRYQIFSVLPITKGSQSLEDLQQEWHAYSADLVVSVKTNGNLPTLILHALPLLRKEVSEIDRMFARDRTRIQNKELHTDRVRVGAIATRLEALIQRNRTWFQNKDLHTDRVRVGSIATRLEALILQKEEFLRLESELRSEELYEFANYLQQWHHLRDREVARRYKRDRTLDDAGLTGSYRDAAPLVIAKTREAVHADRRGRERILKAENIKWFRAAAEGACERERLSLPSVELHKKKGRLVAPELCKKSESYATSVAAFEVPYNREQEKIFEMKI